MPTTLERPRTLFDRVAPAATYLNAARFPGVWFSVTERNPQSVTLRASWLDDGSFADFYVAEVGGEGHLEGCYVSMPAPVETIPLECSRCPYDATEGAPELYPAALFTAVILALRANDRTAWRL
jgi:hypothetical protein